MKLTMKPLTLLLVAFWVTVNLASSVTAQCVACKTSGACFTCKPAANGGCECAPVQCDDCVVSIPCPRKGGCGDGGGDVVIIDAKSARSDVRRQEVGSRQKAYKVNAGIIREIAQRHPRFARMLAGLNKAGGIKTWSRVTSFPAPLEASEVENWLKPPEETRDFFKAYQARRVPGAELVVYEFTVEEVDASHAVIRGEIMSGFPDDPPGTMLVIEVVKGRAVNWRVD